MTKKTVFKVINELLIYAKKNLFLNEHDLAYKRNRILEILGIDTLEECGYFEEVSDVEPSKLLSDLIDACVVSQICVSLVPVVPILFLCDRLPVRVILPQQLVSILNAHPERLEADLPAAQGLADALPCLVLRVLAYFGGILTSMWM